MRPATSPEKATVRQARLSEGFRGQETADKSRMRENDSGAACRTLNSK